MFKSDFYKKLFNLALPIAFQNLVISSVNLVDVFMIGTRGETAIAALGLANQIMFLFILCLFGVNSGSGIFTAQFFGKRDMKSVHGVLGLSIMLGLSIGMLFFTLGWWFPETAIGFYSKDPAVIEAGARYLEITVWSYPIVAISFAFAMQLRSVGKALLPMWTSTMALLVNGFLNYLLIFGKFGFPEMGIEGAAWATTIARTLECLVMIAAVYILKYPLASRFEELLSVKKEFFMKYLKVSSPVFINELVWALGITAHNVVYARLGTRAVAAVNIENSVERIAFVAFIGIANAAATMLGHEIGAGKMNLAGEYAKKLVTVSFIVSGAVSLGVFLFADPILNLYEMSGELRDMCMRVLLIFCVILPFRAFNALNIVGILRSGGDTKAALYIETGALWLVSVPLAVAGGIFFKWPLYVVFLLACSEELVKFILGIRRYLTGKWINNLVNEKS